MRLRNLIVAAVTAREGRPNDFHMEPVFLCRRYRLRFSFLLRVLMLVILPSISEAHAPGVVLSGFGTATINGVVEPGEWDNAGCLSFPVNLPEGGTTPGQVCAMNDQANLYLLIGYARTFVDAGNTADFTFDNNHNGVIYDNGDDVVLINPGFFLDAFRSNQAPCPPGGKPGLCGFRDIDFGGTNDGAGAFHNDGTFTVYEFSHPLNTADNAHDFSLVPGSTVGFILSVRLISSNNVIADTYFPGQPLTGGLGDIVIAFPSLRVDIDIKPGTFPNNPINPKSRGVIPVAILTTSAFDAAVVDWTTVRFGPSGTEAPAVRAALEDIDGDGDKDMVLQFRTEETGTECGVTAMSLTGQTFNGQAIQGSNSVTTVGCK